VGNAEKREGGKEVETYYRGEIIANIGGRKRGEKEGKEGSRGGGS
jgi:hypothetical protein